MSARPTARRGAPISFVVLLVIAVVVCAPLLMTLLTSVKPADEAGDPLALPSRITFEFFAKVWNEGFDRYFANSLIISTVDAVVMIVIASLAGYAMVFIRFPGKTFINVLLLGALMVPATAIVLPLYSSVRSIGLINTRLGVIVSDLALALPVFVLLFGSYFRKIPASLHEAARIDGATEAQIYFRVILPTAVPVIITTGLLEFLWSWNDLLLRLLLLPGEESRTLAVGLLLYQGSQTRDVSSLSAGAVIMSAPVVVLFLLFQRHFVRGMTAGAVK
jgi:ABC-type glycerol-3-phosphate transport system permease component